MNELQILVRVRKAPEGVQTTFELLNQEAAKDFGPWQGLPEVIQALLHCALLLEGRMQIMKSLEEGQSPSEDDLPPKVIQMLDLQVRTLLPQALQRCFAELERIQVS